MYIINDNFFMSISLDIVDKLAYLIHISYKNNQWVTFYIFGGLPALLSIYVLSFLSLGLRILNND